MKRMWFTGIGILPTRLSCRLIPSISLATTDWNLPISANGALWSASILSGAHG